MIGFSGKIFKVTSAIFCWNVAVASAALKAEPLDEFHPVILTSTTGTVDKNSDRLLVEAFSSALKSGALRTLGREFYGVGGEAFAGVGSKGPIGVLSRFLKQSDVDMAGRLSAVYSAIKAPASDKKTTEIELFWTRRTFTGQSSSLKSTPMSLILKLLLPEQSSGFSQEPNPFAIQMGGKLLPLQIVRSRDVPGGGASLVTETLEFVRLTAAQYPKSWLPAHIHASLTIERDRTVKTRVSVSMKPVGFQKAPKEAGDFVIYAMKYEPIKDETSLVTASFDRVYSPSDVNSPRRAPPIVDLGFGPARPENLDIKTCVGNDCFDRLDKVPTIYARLDSGWLWNFLAGTLSLNEFKILVNKLAVDIDQMIVVGPNSELPIAMRTQTWGWKMVDTNRNLRPLNPIEAIQKSLIADSVSQGISSELKNAGDKAEQSLNVTLKPIVQFLQ